MLNKNNEEILFIIMSEKDKKSDKKDDLDDLLDEVFEIQDQMHPRCRISDDDKERQKRWNEKYKKG